jgi:hypothetical protein
VSALFGHSYHLSPITNLILNFDATVLFSAARNPEDMNRSLLSVAKKREDVVLLCTWVVVDAADIKLIFMALGGNRTLWHTIRGGPAQSINPTSFRQWCEDVLKPVVLA